MSEPSAPVYLALDIGGTKMAAGVVDADGRVLASSATPTPRDADAEELFRTATFVVAAAQSRLDVVPLALGVGCGGPMRWPQGVVSPLNIPGWRDFPLGERLAAHFQLPVRVHNDAICLTVGEHLVGSGQGSGNVLGMVVSTGVGGGLVADNRLVHGVSGNAGHIGHVVVDPDGPPCACGGQGCLEAVARGPALVEWAARQGWQGDPTGVALAQSARVGDAIAAAAFRRCGTAVGRAVASTAALLDLDVAVLGGGISRAGDLMLPTVFEAFTRHAGLDFVRRCRIVLAAPDAGLVGAAALFLAADRYWNAPT